MIAALVLGGVGAFLYPKAAAWVSQYNQSKVIASYTHDLSVVQPSASQQLAKAVEYNRLLSSGVVLEANTNKPTGSGTASSDLDYNSLLRVDDAGMMARLRIESIGVDLPVYHGTSDETLLKGAGHLEGSSLPVGGVGTHSVITAHRGLASATMFSNLDRVAEGDTFVIEVFDQVLTYQVVSSNVVEPSDTPHWWIWPRLGTRRESQGSPGGLLPAARQSPQLPRLYGEPAMATRAPGRGARLRRDAGCV